jgi:hypothetical protein
MSFSQVEEISRIPDYAACREATIDFVRNEANALLDIIYAAALFEKNGQYQIYRGMKGYYDSDSRDIADSAWEDHLAFGNFAEKLKMDEESLRLLNEAALMERLWYSYSLQQIFFRIDAYSDPPPCPLASADRRKFAGLLLNYTERLEARRREIEM